MNQQNQTSKPKASDTTINAIKIGNQHCVILKMKVRYDQVPVFIPKYDRATDAMLDKKHQDEVRAAGQKDLGKFGRHREGRVDTGESLAIGADGKAAAVMNCSLGSILNQLKDAGFALANYGYYQKDGDDKYSFIQFICYRGADEMALRRETVEGVMVLLDSVWQNIWVYDNPNGTITINCNNRQAGASRHMLRCVDGELTARAVPKSEPAKTDTNAAASAQ